MLVSAALGSVRYKLADPQTDGFFSPGLLLDLLNDEVKAAITELWNAGWWLYLDGLVERETSLALNTGDDDEYYYAWASLSYTPYKPSLLAWFGDVPGEPLSPYFFFKHRQTNLSFIEQHEKITIRGDRIYVYNPSSTTMRVTYVKIPSDYSTSDTLPFDDDINRNYLIPKIVSAAKLLDSGLVFDKKWEARAEKHLAGMKIAALPFMNPLEQISRNQLYDKVAGGGISPHASSGNNPAI